MTGAVRRLETPDSFGRGWDGRLVWAAAALLLLLHFGLAWLGREPGVHVMRDDARYLLLARSLGQGELFDLYRVDETPHTLYPPGYPALLLAWGAITGGSFASQVLLNVLFSTGALALAFAGLRRIASPGVALLCLLPLVVNPWLVARAGSLRSEAPYAFFSLLALWALVRWRGATGPPGERGSGPPRGRGAGRAEDGGTGAALGIGAAVLATLIRINGLALIVAMVIRWVWRRRLRAVAALLGATLVTVGAWMAWATLVQQGAHESTYVGDIARTIDAPGRSLFEALRVRVVDRAWRIFVRTFPMAMPIPTIEGTLLDNLVSVAALTASLGAGLWILLRRWTTAALYVLTYGAVLFAWPYLQLRFFEPVLPLLIPAVLLGGAALVGLVRPSWRLPGLAALSLFVTASASAQTAGHVAERLRCGPFDLADPPECLTPGQQSFLAALDLVNRETPPDAVFYSTMPEPLFYHTGRRSIPLDEARRVDEEELVSYLRYRGVTHVLLTPNSRRAAGALARRCDELALVERVADRTALLRLPPAGPPPAEGAAAGERAGTADNDGACAAIAEHEGPARDSPDGEDDAGEGDG